MAENFDPYYKWLGIPPKDQPPHHYRLLGIEVLEPDRDVIDAAANRLMGYLKELAAGDDAAHSQKLLNEISRARLCLLNKDKKAAYDRELKAKLQAEEEKAVAQPPETAQPAPPPPPAFPPVAELPVIAAPPHIEIGPVASRLDARLKPPPLKSRGSSAPTVREDMEEDADERSDDERERPLVTRRSSNTMLYVAVVGAVTMAIIAIAVTLLMQTPAVDDSPQTTSPVKGASQEFSGSGLLTMVLTDEARGEITAFILDDQPQSLPPPEELRLNAGRHTIILRRQGYEEVFDRITLVKGVRRDYRPRWRREPAASPVSPAGGLPALPPLPPFSAAAKPLPEMPVEAPVPVQPPSAAETPPPPPEPAAPPSSTPPATDAEIQEAALHGFSSGYGRMVAAWLLNGDGLDQSGHRHNGIAMMANGGTPTYVEARLGTGLQMAPDVQFEVAEPILKDASEFSVTLWVNLAGLPESSQPLVNGESTAIFVQGGFPRVEIGGRKPLPGPDTDPATGGFRGIELSSSLNAWVHLGFVFSARLRQVHYYLNGERRGCQQFADALPAAWNRTIVTGWSGILDETRVFNYRLSSSDMKSVFEGAFQPLPSPPRQPDGVLVCETWFDVAPTSPRREVEDRLGRKPDTTSVMETSLSCVTPAGAGDRLDRVQGFLYPPASGEYTFQLQGSGRATLYLQQSGPLQDTLQETIVSEPGQAATSPRIALDTGKPCHFEIRHFSKGDAGPSLRLGWRLPGSAEPVEAIPAAHFSSYRGRPSSP